jgi:hypothetical protein
MARVRFLAPAGDPRPGQEGIVYGPQHETDFGDEDVDYVMSLWREGKVEILDSTGLTPPAGDAGTQSKTKATEEKPKVKE